MLLLLLVLRFLVVLVVVLLVVVVAVVSCCSMKLLVSRDIEGSAHVEKRLRNSFPPGQQNAVRDGVKCPFAPDGARCATLKLKSPCL